MMRDKPFIQVSIGGNAVASAFYSVLISASLHDAPGQDADTLDLVFDDANNILQAPEKGTKLDVVFGYRDFASALMGQFIVDKVEFTGDDGGEKMSIACRSADLKEDLKEPLSEHFDNETIGSIVSQLASRHGLQAKVSDNLSNIKLSYIARTEQSSLDFLTRLADRHDGLFAIKNGQMLFVERQSGSASGGQLATLNIDKTMCESWSISDNPRPHFEKAQHPYYKRDTGQTLFKDSPTGLKGPRQSLRHILSSEAEALNASKAEASKLSRASRLRIH